MPEQNRIQITLSAYERRLLKLWAALHGRPLATYAAQIIGARIEANADLIRKEIREMAKSQGIEESTLIAQILKTRDTE